VIRHVKSHKLQPSAVKHSEIKYGCSWFLQEYSTKTISFKHLLLVIKASKSNLSLILTGMP